MCISEIFIPNGKRVLVLQDDVQEKTKTGIILSPAVTEKPAEGYIVSIPKGKSKGFTIGQKVVFGKYAGIKTTIDDVEYVILDMIDILGTKIKEEKCKAD